MSHLQFCRTTLSRDEVALCMSHAATLSHKQELANQRLATKLHRIYHCSIQKRSCMSHVQFDCATVLRLNRRCDTGLKLTGHHNTGVLSATGRPLHWPLFESVRSKQEDVWRTDDAGVAGADRMRQQVAKRAASPRPAPRWHCRRRSTPGMRTSVEWSLQRK